jgi:hypothetical protein
MKINTQNQFAVNHAMASSFRYIAAPAHPL